jgi:hypothetical protein
MNSTNHKNSKEISITENFIEIRQKKIQSVRNDLRTAISNNENTEMLKIELDHELSRLFLLRENLEKLYNF